jgi:hypothetical protein
MWLRRLTLTPSLCPGGRATAPLNPFSLGEKVSAEGRQMRVFAPLRPELITV